MIRNLLLAAALMMSALPVSAQSAAEQLQRGIFAQESQGNLDTAIAIYRQVAYSGLTPRDIVAEAQYRLAQALLAKGEVPAAAREFERLEREFADYRKLVAGLANARVAQSSSAAGHGQWASGALGALVAEARSSRFDSGAQFGFRGRVTRFEWLNPRCVLVVDTGSQKYVVQLTTPPAMLEQGITRFMFTVNQEVVVQAIQPNQGRLSTNETEVVQANGISSPDGKVIFDWSKVAESARAPVDEKK